MVTIIIPTYNRLELLKRSVKSVLEQSYEDFTLIVVDDGSTDETQEYLKKLTDPRITVMSQKNLGVSAARNAGIMGASTEWIAFLDSDDEWLPHKLKTQIDFIKKNPQFEFIHSNEIWVRNGVRVNAPKRFDKSNDRIFERSLETCLISPSTVMVKKLLLEKWNYFDDDFIICEDYDLWLKILGTQEVGFIEENLITKYAGHEQLSTQFVAMDYWRLKSLVNLLSFAEFSDVQKNQIVTEIKKKLPLLMKGFEKYQDLDKIKEIQDLIKSCKYYTP